MVTKDDESDWDIGRLWSGAKTRSAGVLIVSSEIVSPKAILAVEGCQDMDAT